MSTTPPVREIPPVKKSPHAFTRWQALLIALVLGIIFEVILIKFTSLRGSLVWCFTMLVFVMILSFIDSPFAAGFSQLFAIIVVVIIVVAFGTETYRVVMASN
jgi:hypothetical protein